MCEFNQNHSCVIRTAAHFALRFPTNKISYLECDPSRTTDMYALERARSGEPVPVNTVCPLAIAIATIYLGQKLTPQSPWQGVLESIHEDVIM